MPITKIASNVARTISELISSSKKNYPWPLRSFYTIFLTLIEKKTYTLNSLQWTISELLQKKRFFTKLFQRKILKNNILQNNTIQFMSNTIGYSLFSCCTGQENVEKKYSLLWSTCPQKTQIHCFYFKLYSNISFHLLQ